MDTPLRRVIETIKDLYAQKKVDFSTIDLVEDSNNKIMIREYVPNENILEFGEQLSHVLFIYEGAYDVFRFLKDGRINLIAGNSAPQFIGAIQLGKTQDEYFQAEIIVRKKCVLFAIAPDYFLEMMKEDYTIALLVIDNLSELLRYDSIKIEQSIFNSAYDRMLNYLYWESKNLPDQQELRIDHSKRKIADIISTNERNVFRILNDLKDNNLIRTSGRSIYVTQTQREKINKIIKETYTHLN